MIYGKSAPSVKGKMQIDIATALKNIRTRSMLDANLQRNLASAMPRRTHQRAEAYPFYLRAIYSLAVAVTGALVGIMIYASFVNSPRIPDERIGRLIVTVGEETGQSPAALWDEMEKRIGKPVSAFNMDDQVAAVEFLAKQIEGAPKKTTNIW
ncbi:hypothetical protein ACFOY8_13710 [Thalassospira xianhensis]|nr:hypothetical protein [Thalassospira xianhensis]